MPGVSVLIPVYNEKPNIAPRVDALGTAMGSGLDWELLLVDDGSSDGTVDRIRAAATADPRIRLIPSPATTARPPRSRRGSTTSGARR